MSPSLLQHASVAMLLLLRMFLELLMLSVLLYCCCCLHKVGCNCHGTTAATVTAAGFTLAAVAAAAAAATVPAREEPHTVLKQIFCFSTQAALLFLSRSSLCAFPLMLSSLMVSRRLAEPCMYPGGYSASGIKQMNY